MSSRLPHVEKLARSATRAAALLALAMTCVMQCSCRAPQSNSLVGQPYDGPACEAGACNCGMHAGYQAAPYDGAVYDEAGYDETWGEPSPQPYDVSSTWTPPGIAAK